MNKVTELDWNNEPAEFKLELSRETTRDTENKKCKRRKWGFYLPYLHQIKIWGNTVELKGNTFKIGGINTFTNIFNLRDSLKESG